MMREVITLLAVPHGIEVLMLLAAVLGLRLMSRLLG